jgi:ketosteroid isomerase-like protein
MLMVPALVALLLQAPPSIPEAEAAASRFMALETQLAGAIQRKDAAALENLIAKDFAFNAILAGRAPIILNRDEWLKGSAHYTLHSFVLKEPGVRMFGDLAVVRVQAERSATVGAAIEGSGEFAVVDVWTKSGDAWKLSARFLSRPEVLKR